jgi:pimeloyl-[acyl-carrier protein] methyl ester esterase
LKMSAMHVDRYGDSGAPLLFIHGWGMHGGMWGGALEKLAEQLQVMAVDLPGHGFSNRIEDRGLRIEAGALDVIVDKLAIRFSGPLTVCGWSLGGQIALRWAQRHPAQVEKLILVSSTPCFVQRADWPCAMAEQTLAAFSAALQQDYASTLRRFLALQVRGGEQEKEQLQMLRLSLMSRGEPDLAALQAGLAILRDVDLRAALSEIAQPTLLIAGDRDTLTPLAASQYMAAQMPAAQMATIAGAAHAPFLSHPEVFVKYVAEFLHG